MLNKGELPSQSDLGLKPDQLEILLVIRNLTRKRNRPPSMREVAEALERKSVGGLAYQYRVLEADGYLRRDPRCPRTVEVRLPGEPAFLADGSEPEQASETGPGADEMLGYAEQGKVVWVPVVARVAAGEPILPTGTDEGRFPLPREVVGEGALFMLKVVGDSMIGAGIVGGDWVVVREQRQAENGEIVAALIDGMEVEGTVKTLKLIDGHRWLMSQNPVHTPILGDRAEIYGKVVAVLRQV
jgi:repressor LexA